MAQTKHDHINEFRELIKTKEFIDSYAVVNHSPFDLIMFPPINDEAPPVPIIAKFIVSKQKKMFLSHYKPQINKLQELSEDYGLPAVLIVRFRGTPQLPVSYSICQIRKTMPIFIKRNPEQDITYL